MFPTHKQCSSLNSVERLAFGKMLQTFNIQYGKCTHIVPLPVRELHGVYSTPLSVIGPFKQATTHWWW